MPAQVLEAQWVKNHVALIAVCLHSVVIRSELSRALYRVSSVDSRAVRTCAKNCVAPFDGNAHFEKQTPRDTRCLKFAT